LLQAVTLFRFKKRVTVHNGIVSTLDDYDRALRIYNGTAANNATNLNGKEMSIMKVIQGSPARTITFTEIQEKTGLKETSLRYTIDGRNGSEGLLGKVKGLYKLDKSETISWDKGNLRSTTKGSVYRYTGNIFELGSKLFESVATIDRDKAERLTYEFIDIDNEKDYNSHNSHTTLTSNVRDENDNSIDNNNNNNNKLTNIGEMGGSNCSYADSDNSAKIEKSHTHNSYDNYVRANCEDSSILWQPTTNHNVRDNVSALAYESTVNESNGESNVRDSNDNILAVVDMLKMALRKFAKEEYHSIVDDLPEFVQKFNEKTPSYLARLGYQRIYDEAGRLKYRGWR